MNGWRRDISWTESIRKCEGKSLYNLVQQMFWYHENGDGNLAVVYASERYDV